MLFNKHYRYNYGSDKHINDFLNTEISWVCLVHSSYFEENPLNEIFKTAACTEITTMLFWRPEFASDCQSDWCYWLVLCYLSLLCNLYANLSRSVQWHATELNWRECVWVVVKSKSQRSIQFENVSGTVRSKKLGFLFYKKARKNITANTLQVCIRRWFSFEFRFSKLSYECSLRFKFTFFGFKWWNKQEQFQRLKAIRSKLILSDGCSDTAPFEINKTNYNHQVCKPFVTARSKISWAVRTFRSPVRNSFLSRSNGLDIRSEFFYEPFERFGYPFGMLYDPFERLGYPFAIFPEPFERLSYPFGILNHPFEHSLKPV